MIRGWWKVMFQVEWNILLPDFVSHKTPSKATRTHTRARTHKYWFE